MTQDTENDPDESENQNVNTGQMTYDPMHDNNSVSWGNRWHWKHLRKHGITRMII